MSRTEAYTSEALTWHCYLTSKQRCFVKSIGLCSAARVTACAGTGVQGDPCTDRTSAECTLEALLRRTEALQLSSMEADRARLISVAARLVQLGARVAAQDAEGRTALHLAAGCGDRAMVLKLVQLGTDVNCRDSVGGDHSKAWKFHRERYEGGVSGCRSHYR